MLFCFCLLTLKCSLKGLDNFFWENWRTGELCYSFTISNDLIQMVNFYTWIPVTITVLLFWICFSSDTNICSVMAFPSLGYSDQYNVWLSFHSKVETQKGTLLSIVVLTTIIMLTGTVLVIIWETFHGRISLKLVLLLLVLNFVSGSTLELIYLSLIIKTSSRFINFFEFQQLVMIAKH